MLQNAAIEADPRPWLRPGLARASDMSLFMHEATHHWCFMSPVGSVLAAMTLRARSELMEFLDGDGTATDLVDRAMIDLFKVEVAVELLRPLVEGIAEFAEFDVVSRSDSEVISPLLRWVAVCFTDRDLAAALRAEYGEPAALDALHQTIALRRIDQETIERKASMLLEPLDTDAGGYLPGYLTVKTLWRSAAAACPRLVRESDLFLMYLRSFFFDDLGLVDVLLNRRHASLTDAAEQVGSCVVQRFNEFLQVRDDDVAAFERALADGDAAGIGPIPGLSVKPGRAMERIAELASWLDEPSATDGLAVFDKSQAYGIMARRQFVNLVVCDVEVVGQPDGQLQLLFDGTPFYVGPGHGAPVIGRRPASLEIVFSMQGTNVSRAMVVVAEGRVVTCDVAGPDDRDETMSAVLRAYQQRSWLLSTELQMREVVEGMRQHMAADELAFLRAQLSEHRRSFYENLSLYVADEVDGPGLAAVMRLNGLLPILKTSWLVRGQALLGLAASVNPRRHFVAQCFREHGLSLDEILAALQACHDRHQYLPRIVEIDQFILSFI